MTPRTNPRRSASRPAVSRMLALLRPDVGWLALVALTAPVAVGAALAGPRLLGDATDLVFHPGRAGPLDRAALARTLAAVAVLYLAGAACTWVQGVVMARVAQRAGYTLRERIADKFTRLPVASFDARERGDLLSLMTNDVENVTTALHESVTQLVTAALTVVGVLAMMFWISGWLTLLTLLTVPLFLLSTALVARRAQARFALRSQRTGDLGGHVEEVFSGLDVVAVHGRREAMIDTFDELNGRLYTAGVGAHVVSGMLRPVTTVLEHLNYVVIAVAGALLMTAGRLTLGDVQAFIQYAWAFTGPVSGIAETVDLLQCGLASSRRVFELIDEPEDTPDVEPPPAGPPAAPPTGPPRVGPRRVGPRVGSRVGPRVGPRGGSRVGPPGGPRRGHVRLDRVSFGYSPGVPVLEDVSLEVEPGRTVAIVGPTGAGKTTLVNLLLRFHEVDAGTITVDGVDIRRMPRDDVRRCFGLVLQETWLFEGTVRENIAYGAPGAGEAAVLRAAALAHADPFVRRLPRGYDTVLHENGANLSAGERQLLALARAFLVDPPVLVLDEATSNVDPWTEILVRRASSSLREGRTSFVVAHRLATVRDADVILVMDGGQIVERGTHEELLARRGRYAQLCASRYQVLGSA